MERLTDFKPIERLTLPGLGDVDCSGLMLIVGPNSSGKTQLLHDLHLRVSGEPRQLVVADEISIRKPEYESLVECLEREGYLTTFDDDTGIAQFRPMTTYLGTGQAANQIPATQAQQWYQQYTPDSGQTRRRNA